MMKIPERHINCILVVQNVLWGWCNEINIFGPQMVD